MIPCKEGLPGNFALIPQCCFPHTVQDKFHVPIAASHRARLIPEDKQEEMRCHVGAAISVHSPHRRSNLLAREGEMKASPC